MTNLLMTRLNGKESDNVADRETPCAHTPQSHRHSNNLHNDRQNQDTSENLVNRKSKLWSWQKNVVAEATIASIDPNSLVHFIKLGSDAWKVWVNVAVEPEAFLFRPNSEMSTIKEVVGSSVAWPKDFVSLV